MARPRALRDQTARKLLRPRQELGEPGGAAQLGPDLLQRIVHELAALAFVEARHGTLQRLGPQAGLGEPAKGAS
jgi:hypothetical protein